LKESFSYKNYLVDDFIFNDLNVKYSCIKVV